MGVFSIGLIGPVIGQSAGVAESSIRVVAAPEKKELAVEFRLVDDTGVTSVTTAAAGKAGDLPTTWEGWEGDNAPACAWLIVVDTSNPGRTKTVGKGVEFVRSFLTGLPKQDAVAVYSLARDLTLVAEFDVARDDVHAGLAGIKTTGDAALTTLIHTNLREALAKFSARKEPRKALLVLTDGMDETAGGVAASEIEKNKLIEAARKAQVVIHTVGYAEGAEGQKYFAALKEMAAQTDGLFLPTSLAAKEVAPGEVARLRGVMHGAGIARVDLGKLTEPADLTLTVKTAAGKTALVKVALSEVAKGMPVVEPTVPKPDEPDKTPEVPEPKPPEPAPGPTVADDDAAAKEAAAKEVADQETKKKKLWLSIGGGVLLAILVTAILMVRASRRRAEEARLAEEERAAQDERRAEAARRQAEEAKKPESPPLAWLEMCDAQQTRHPVRIPNLKIGRGQHNDLVLRNDSISGNHCVLNCNREGEWTITDLNSGNGVILNGTQIVQASLRHGDTIELGELKMHFLLRA
jgi:hypothetical protein